MVPPEVLGTRHPAGESAAHERFLHRPLAGLIRVHLGVARQRHGTGHLPPGVEHVGHVAHVACLLGGSQQQVVVLGAVEARAEPAGALDEVAAQHQEVADVVDGEEEVRRPVGLEEGLAVAPVAEQDVLVGVHDVELRVGLEQLHHAVHGMRPQDVVVVQQGDELTGGELERARGCSRDAAVRGAVHDLDPRVGSSKLFQNVADVRGSRGVVGDAELPVLVHLSEHRVDRRPKPVLLRVVGRHDDADQRSRGPQAVLVAHAVEVFPGRLVPSSPLVVLRLYAVAESAIPLADSPAETGRTLLAKHDSSEGHAMQGTSPTRARRGHHREGALDGVDHLACASLAQAAHVGGRRQEQALVGAELRRQPRVFRTQPPQLALVVADQARQRFVSAPETHRPRGEVGEVVGEVPLKAKLREQLSPVLARADVEVRPLSMIQWRRCEHNVVGVRADVLDEDLGAVRRHGLGDADAGD